MTLEVDQAWKQFAPCRAADPVLFEVPEEPEQWETAQRAAEQYCTGCPFLWRCAEDPDSGWGIWAGSARWVRGGEVLFRRLIPTAPPPPFRRIRDVTPTLQEAVA